MTHEWPLFFFLILVPRQAGLWYQSVVSMALVALMCSFAERLFSLFSLYGVLLFYFLLLFLRSSKGALSKLEADFFFAIFCFCV